MLVEEWNVQHENTRKFLYTLILLYVCHGYQYSSGRRGEKSAKKVVLPFNKKRFALLVDI